MSYACKSCSKKYTQKTAHQNHEVLCELLKSSKNEDESSELPSYKNLVKLVGILAIKNSKLEIKYLFPKKDSFFQLLFGRG